MNYQLHAIPVDNALQNYIWLLIAPDHNHCVVVDPTYAEPVIEYCDRMQLSIDQIWVTHKHADHIGGVAELATYSQAAVYAPEAERDAIKSADIWLCDHDHINWRDLTVQVLATPGHTLGHLCFYCPQIKVLFSGDTLFVMGCGRKFEGSYEMLYQSLQRLARLPDDTLVYCSHEYSLTNAEFCLSIAPEDVAIRQRRHQLKQLRDHHQITLPSTIAAERATNLFIRAANAAEFEYLRRLKDDF